MILSLLRRGCFMVVAFVIPGALAAQVPAPAAESLGKECFLMACRHAQRSFAFDEKRAASMKFETLEQMDHHAKALGLQACLAQLTPRQIGQLHDAAICMDSELTGDASRPLAVMMRDDDGVHLCVPGRRNVTIEMPQWKLFPKRVPALVIARERLPLWLYIPWWARSLETVVPVFFAVAVLVLYFRKRQAASRQKPDRRKAA